MVPTAEDITPKVEQVACCREGYHFLHLRSSFIITSALSVVVTSPLDSLKFMIFAAKLTFPSCTYRNVASPQIYTYNFTIIPNKFMLSSTQSMWMENFHI